MSALQNVFRNICFALIIVSLFLISPISYSDASKIIPKSKSLHEQKKKSGFDDIDPLLQYKISEDMGHDNNSFHLKKQGDIFLSEKTLHGLKFNIGITGLNVFQGAYNFGLGLKAVKQGDADIKYEREIAKAEVRANRLTLPGSRIKGLIKEWYVNGPHGIQQGWTVAKRLGNNKADFLTMELASFGNLGINIENGQSISLKDTAGNTIMHYRGLYAYDKDKKKLKTWFEKQDETVLIKIADKDACYPITIDPWIQKAKLTASDKAAYDGLGISVSVSSDGVTVVAGAEYADPGSTSNAGAVYVYVKSGDSWADATQTAKLTAFEKYASAGLGRSVSISSDGGTVVAGAYNANPDGITGAGAAYVYVKPGSNWITATETARLTASDKAASDALGMGVSISSDGGTVVAGAYQADHGTSNVGAAYVYVKPVGGWANTTQTAKLFASDRAASDQFGYSVSISSDGGTVVAGANLSDPGTFNEGSAYVYVKPGSGWANAPETAKLTASDKAASDSLGVSVSVSSDGGTVVAGAYCDDLGGTSDAGSAYVYVKPGGGWANATQTAKLTASDKAASASLGRSVSISSDGGTVVAGANAADSEAGAVYVYVKPESGWADATQTAKLIASDRAASDQLGISVSASSDGGTLVAGAFYASPGITAAGAVYIFFTPTVPTLITQAVTSISYTTATGNGNITATNGANATVRGFCWSTNTNPTTSDSKTTENGNFTTGAFTGSITGLTAGTSYHIRAYATNSAGTNYGGDVSFTTEAGTPGLWKTNAASTDWGTPGNWDDGNVPTGTTDVIIPDSTNKPVLDANRSVKNLTIQTNGSVTISGAYTLLVGGNLEVQNGGTIIISNGSGVMDISGTFNQVGTGALTASNGGKATIHGNVLKNGTTCLTVSNSASIEIKSNISLP